MLGWWEMAKRKPRIILRIGPAGFRKFPIRVSFTDKKEDLIEYTRGEGQALRFVLEDADCSSEFYKALQSGEFLEVFKQERWELTIVDD